MCIIAGETESIASTKILVSKYESKQLTVYSNKVTIDGNGDSVVMILPFPNKNNKIDVIETNSKDMKCFTLLKNCFINRRSRCSYSNDSTGDNDRPIVPLEVFRSGNYQYSIARNVTDLDLLNKNVFKKTQELNNLLLEYSNNNFGFIACIIDKNVMYSPFAYLYDIVNNELFIPTKHYHEPSKNFQNLFTFYNTNPNNYDNHWDHEIYVLNTKNKNAFSDYEEYENTSFSKYINNCSKEKMFLISIHGYHKNQDMTILL